MAFMAKLQGKVYDGEHIAAADLRNGDLVNFDASNEVAKIAAANDYTFAVVEKEGPYGLQGLRLRVVKQGDSECFLVENIPEQICEYDETTYGPKKGEFVRMHRLLAGDEFHVFADDTLFAAATVGGTLTIGADGALTA